MLLKETKDRIEKMTIDFQIKEQDLKDNIRQKEKQLDKFMKENTIINQKLK